MAERSILQIVLEFLKKGDGVKDASKDLGDLKKASGEAGKAADTLNLGMLAVEGAAISAGIAVLKSIPALVEQGLEYERSTVALAAFTGGAEEAAAAVEAVQNAAGGSVSKMLAAESATRLFSMGLAETTDEAAELTRIAVTLGATMGRGPSQAFEEFSLLLANQSIPRLDTFGISASQVRARMADLTAANQDLSREQAFMTATTEIAGEKLAALDAEGFEAASSLDRMKTVVADTKLGIATFLAEGLMPYVDMLAFGVEEQKKFADATTEQKDAVDDLAEAYANLPRPMEETDEAATDLATTTFVLEGGFRGVGLGANFAADAQDELANTSYDLISAEEEVYRVSGILTKSMGRLTEQMLFQAAAAALDEDAQIELAFAMGLIDERSYNALRTIEEFAEGLDGSQDSVDEYTRKVTELADKLNSLPETIDIRIQMQMTAEGVTADVTGDAGVETAPGGYQDAGSPEPQAHGGAVHAGAPYIVGEVGAELFVPGQNGTVIPNSDIAGGTNINQKIFGSVTLQLAEGEGIGTALAERLRQ